MIDLLRTHALSIWQAALDAARPEPLVHAALQPLRESLERAPRILVVGAGKAGGAMAEAVETALPDFLGRMEGLVNVPADAVRPLRRIELHAARPRSSNFPTAAGVVGTRRIRELVGGARPEDVCLCLLSGGGSALLPEPVEGLTLDDVLEVTRLLHACGATINEMNAVRKHLSAITGGRLAQAFSGRALHSLIISDVVGDPLEVIASGPTSADPTTFGNALEVCRHHGVLGRLPPAVLEHLKRGKAGAIPETPKSLPANISNWIIGNNARSLAAAQQQAEALGYRVLNLGSFIEGETAQVAAALGGIAQSIRWDGLPLTPPVCVLSGGETTVTLAPEHGRGGRNQEFVLAALIALGQAGMDRVILLSGGTDGEDGPTDAAGAVADAGTLARAAAQNLSPPAFLSRNDAYSFFTRTGDLLITGLTETNVMDVRIMLVG
jgi:hydroxypyruvate reductase/glycerate 2-kinase